MTDLYAFAALHRHYRICRRNKRTTANALRFELDAETNLLALQAELRAHTYRPGRSICFVTDGPKPREVFAADFRDRIVHHLVVDYQQRIFEPRFIHDSYACRPHKGTLAGSDRLMAFLRAATANGRRPAWALTLDVASFFTSIHKATLFDLIRRRVRNREILWLTEVLLFHDPTQDYRFRSLERDTPPPGSAGYPVPARKSLFGTDNVRGLPIGNLTSQFWANVYLNELDQFAKRELGCRWYLRYVDDVVLLAAEPDTLRRWRDGIAAFLDSTLRLRLREPDVEPAPVGRGVRFVGCACCGACRRGRCCSAASGASWSSTGRSGFWRRRCWGCVPAGGRGRGTRCGSDSMWAWCHGSSCEAWLAEWPWCRRTRSGAPRGVVRGRWRACCAGEGWGEGPAFSSSQTTAR